MKIGVLGTGMVGETIGTQARRARPRGDDGLAHGRQREGGGMGGRGRRRRPRRAPSPTRAAFGELVFNCTAGTALARGARARRARRTSRARSLDRRRQPARLLEGHAADAVRLQHRLARRADPARVPGGQGGQGAQHGELRASWSTRRACPGDARRLRVRQRRRAQGAGRRSCSTSFGWQRRIIDLGDITAARGTEMYLPLWLRLWARRSAMFNIKVVRCGSFPR